MYTCTHIMHTCTHAHVHTHPYMHTRTHTCTHARTHMHTHTHTCTHTCMATGMPHSLRNFLQSVPPLEVPWSDIAVHVLHRKVSHQTLLTVIYRWTSARLVSRMWLSDWLGLYWMLSVLLAFSATGLITCLDLSLQVPNSSLIDGVWQHLHCKT